MKLTVFLLSIFSWTSLLADGELNLYLDADFHSYSTSSIAIKRGFELALEEVDFTIQGRKIKLLEKDHRGNTRRSRKNISRFLKDENALLMISGIHSPPLISLKNYINENGVLFLVPWAAGAPITRASTNENWIFRLSLDDSKVGGYLANYALNNTKANKACLLLEETGWGRGNFKNISLGLEGSRIKIQHTEWFKWGLKKNQAKEIVSRLEKKSCELVFLVSNALEGSVLVKELATRKMSIPVLSHWGIAAGKFYENVSFEEMKKVDLKFIQTKFSFLSKKQTILSQKIGKRIIEKYDDVKSLKDIRAPTGYIHGYDLGKILVTALKNIELKNKSAVEIRKLLKVELENTNAKTEGLVKTYHKAFNSYTTDKPDAHEALNENDYSIAIFGEDGEIKILD